MDDLMLLKRLGEGQFGKVFLLRNKIDNNLYALKCIKKQKIIQNKMEKITI